MTDRTIIRGKIRIKEIRPGYKTTGGIVVHPMDSERGSVPVAVLIGDGAKVGGFEPWMAETCLKQASNHDEKYGDQCGDPMRAIAAAISELYQEDE